jgi:hypothetical protein
LCSRLKNSVEVVQQGEACCGASRDWSTFASLGAPLCSRLKMQTQHHLRWCGFVFLRSLQEQALGGSQKNKTPLKRAGFAL